MSLIDDIASALGGATKTPSGYLCRCPCHADKSASLSIKEVDGGTNGLLFNCFAGCTFDSIKAELERRGLLNKSNRPKTSERKTKYDGAKFYIYRDLVGNPICRKVKLPDKKMWFERYESNRWIAKLNNITVPLYNLAAVITDNLIYLCEGEKDAETLITAGLTATTNHAGALGWAEHLTEQLKDKSVIIIPDNDDAGKKRVAMLTKRLSPSVKELRVFIPDNVPEHGDITDWVNAGGNPTDILAKSIIIEKKQTPKKASRQEYYDLFDSILKNPKRCIFSQKLMHYDEDSGLWNPSINSLEILKSEALYLNETRETKFVIDSIKPHFFAYEASKPSEFLIDIPDWDGELRLDAMASLVRLNPDQGISPDSFTELLKEWCSTMFRRLEDPTVQNRILILQGGQGIGKDTWISMLVDGLGQFAVPWANVREDKDTYLQLHRGLVMKIPEFDKTRNADNSTLKDLITAPTTDLRAPYDKDSKVRLNRCSFISSTNPKNILRDSTGNRRYLIFELQSIQYAYAGWSKEKIHDWQMQCLAEMRILAEDNYRASPAAWREMNEYIEQETPEDYAEDIAEQFLMLYRAQNLMFQGVLDITPKDESIQDMLAKLAKNNSLKLRTVKSMIQSRIGIFKRIGNKRFWAWRIPDISANGHPSSDIERESANI